MKLLKLLPLLGIAILVYIVYKVGFIEIYQILITANLFYLLIAILILSLGVTLLAYKWYVILQKQGIDVDFLYAFKIYLIGTFYGTITPARAGSIIRASYLKEKKGKSFGECMSGIIIERLMDLFVLFVFSTIGVILFSKYISSWLPMILIFFTLFGLGALFLLKKNVNRYFFKFVHKFLIPAKLKDKSVEIYDAFYTNIPSFKNLIYPLSLTFLTWILLGTHIFFIAKSYSVIIPLFYTIFIVTIGTIISLIPITVGGMGTREATWIFLFSLFKIEAAKVVSVSFLALILGLLVPLVGFLYSLKEPHPERLL